MTTPIEITKKLARAVAFNKADINRIVEDYMRELLMDMGQRYGMTELTHHIVAAAFKIQADMLYSNLDKEGKQGCDTIIGSIDSTRSAVQKVSMPIEFEIKEED